MLSSLESEESDDDSVVIDVGIAVGIVGARSGAGAEVDCCVELGKVDMRGLESVALRDLLHVATGIWVVWIKTGCVD